MAPAVLELAARPVLLPKQASFLLVLSRPLCWPEKISQAGLKTAMAGFLILVQTNLFPNRFRIYFTRGKHGDFVWDLFPTGIRPPPLYKRKDQ
jgi:hypothetical protein